VGQYAAMPGDDPRGEAPVALAPAPSSASRDSAIERLSAAFAHGTLDTEEFERRVTIVHRCSSRAEIDGCLADVAPETALVPATLDQHVAPSRHELVPATTAPAAERTLSVLGSTTRAGRWSVARRLVVRAVLGNVELDFRQAILPAGIVELEVKAVFGNIEITVPPHLAVEANGSTVLGNFDHLDRARADLAPDAPVLRITGTSVLGNVEIVTRPADDDEAGTRRSPRQLRGRAT
jgi:hypothetical protein